MTGLRMGARILHVTSIRRPPGGPQTDVSDTGAKVEDLVIDVMDLSPEKVGTFDVVMMLGVLYHMRHPMLCLELAYSVTGDQLIMETHVDFVNIRRPEVEPVVQPDGVLDDFWRVSVVFIDGFDFSHTIIVDQP